MCVKNFDVKDCEIISAKEIAKDTFDFVLQCPELAKLSKAGQFVHIYLPGRVLRRPISICDIGEDTIRIVFQIRGEGTFEMAQFKKGDKLNIIAPLGNGFTLKDKTKKAMFVGGGIGVPPLLGASKYYGENATVAVGFRDKDTVILEKDFGDYGCKLKIATDDGSYGHHGLVSDLFEGEKPDIIYACGPTPMLKAVVKFAEENGIECEISLEERMACGVGACLGCATRLLRENGEEYFGHVCKDGPVFNYKKVVL
ncbi:MAG: dihydroorotate dehydrogenase electron transfer subunit [Clostridia bacterium]